MSKSNNGKSMKKRIGDFRLAAASEILGNLVDTSIRTIDMQHIFHIGELCDQYSLLIVLNWLATKYGFPLCNTSMLSESKPSLAGTEMLPLLSWPSLANRYPLQLFHDQGSMLHLCRQLYSILDFSFEPRLELVGEIYQQILSAPVQIDDAGCNAYIELQSDGRSMGEFYTPAWAAEFALQQWLDSESDILISKLRSDSEKELPRILDPSCGTGNFLLAAMQMFKRIEVFPDKVIRFAMNGIFGNDIDGRAVELCKLLILIELSSDLQKVECKQADMKSLLEQLDKNVCLFNSLLDGYCHGKKRFDLVITNPPYISFGSRDQQQISREWQQALKNRFPASAEYKLRFTSIFQEMGIDAISSESQNYELRSHCIFLVPDAFLTGSYYQKLRSLILDNVDIVSLAELPESTIGGATVGRWCLAHYAEKNGTADNVVRLQSLVGQWPVMSKIEFDIPQTSLISADKQRFQLVFSSADLEIVNHCRSMGWLKQELRGYTGIRARNGQASIVSDKRKGDKYHPGLLSGAELRPYCISWAGNWIEIDPRKLFAGGFNSEVIEGSKILVRQTGDRLIAAADLKSLFHLNNIHSFVPVDPKRRQDKIHFYTSLLNSSFYLYYYQLKTREKKRALAQIDIETVEHMPLPPRHEKVELELENLGQQIHLAKQNEYRELQSHIDSLVFELFQLDNKMIRHITKLTAPAEKERIALGARTPAGIQSSDLE